MSKSKVNGQVLCRRLIDFEVAMLEKFYAVEHKHKGNSVTDDEVDWLTFDWDAIEEHFWEEVKEVSNTLTNPLASYEMRAKELVDVANMAFLLWWRTRVKRITETA